MLVKAAVLLALGRLFRLERKDRLLLALSLAQVGEFAFVLFQFAVQRRVLAQAQVSLWMAVVALSMLLTPLVLLAFERLVLPRLTARSAAPEREADPVKAQDGAVVIAGFGRFGQIVGRLLRASGVPTTVLDLDPDIVGVVRRVGLEVHYGDASRLDLLHAAGCARARLFVLAVDDPQKSLDIGHMVRKHFPTLPILARARSRQHYYQLTRLEPMAIVRETLGSALELGEQALKALGFRGHQAHRLARNFQRHDEAAIRALAPLFGQDEKAFFAAAREALEQTEKLLREESGRKFGDEHSWDTESLREDASSRG
jgi:voltage-gated potassium channel Kch